MINYLKWLFRRKLVHTVSGTVEINHGDQYGNSKVDYCFYMYNGWLGRSWEYCGPSFQQGIRSLKAYQKIVRPWIETGHSFYLTYK